MSKMYKKYLELKQKDNNKKYLFKAGLFSMFLEKDALDMSREFGFKLLNLNNEIKKCSIPTKYLERYIKKFNEYMIDIEVIEYFKEKSDIYSNNVDIIKTIDIIKEIDMINTSPKELYDIIYKIKENFKK